MTYPSTLSSGKEGQLLLGGCRGLGVTQGPHLLPRAGVGRWDGGDGSGGV